MRANPEKIYALVQNGRAHQIFTIDELPEWSDSLDVVDVTDLDPRPQEGWLYSGGAFIDPATTPEAIAAAAEARKAAMDATRDARIFGGVAYMGHVFDTDPRSVMNLTGTLAAVASGAIELPEPFYWRSRDNVNVEMTLADLKGLAAAMVATGYQAYLESWAAKDAVTRG